MRRGPGIGGLKKREAATTKYAAVGAALETTQLAHLTKQLSLFKDSLATFALKHKQEINKNPIFRRQFQEMCAKVGVDPLASHKGFWASLLGVGDFYYELGIQVVEVCMITRQANGGLISLEELMTRLRRMRSKKAEEISSDDVIYSVKKLAALGNGFQVLVIGGNQQPNGGGGGGGTGGGSGGGYLNSPSGGIASSSFSSFSSSSSSSSTVTTLTTSSSFSSFSLPSSTSTPTTGRVMILSVPTELNRDHMSILELAQESGCVSEELISSKLGWPKHRVDTVMEVLMNEGMVWVDDQAVVAGGRVRREYWFASIYLEALNRSNFTVSGSPNLSATESSSNVKPLGY